MRLNPFFIRSGSVPGIVVHYKPPAGLNPFFIRSGSVLDMSDNEAIERMS